MNRTFTRTVSGLVIGAAIGAAVGSMMPMRGRQIRNMKKGATMAAKAVGDAVEKIM